MYILLVVIFLIGGQKDVRASIVEGPTAYRICQEARPLYEKLYKTGKFHDGPKSELIKKVRTRCEPVPEDNNLADTEKPALKAGLSF